MEGDQTVPWQGGWVFHLRSSSTISPRAETPMFEPAGAESGALHGAGVQTHRRGGCSTRREIPYIYRHISPCSSAEEIAPALLQGEHMPATVLGSSRIISPQ